MDKMKLHGWEVTEDYQERDNINKHKYYSVFKVDVQVEYKGKLYDLVYTEENENENGGAGAEMFRPIKDKELEQELINFVEELGANGEFYQ